MLLGLTYQLVLFVVDLVLVHTRSDAQLHPEVLALRYQLRVVDRKGGNLPGSQVIPSCLLASAGCSRDQAPLRCCRVWQGDLVRRKWSAFGQRRLRPHPARDPKRSLGLGGPDRIRGRVLCGTRPRAVRAAQGSGSQGRAGARR